MSIALVALTFAVFAPVRHFPFVSWDDPQYVSANAVVSRGLTPAGVLWASSSPGLFYWHPVTWLSHMTDVQLFGLQAGAHHVTNVILHAAGTLLLFWVLRLMTGRTARSALVAALFAIHPLHVESVAWIAERKDVLSGVFWMLTLWAYVSYVRDHGRARYAAVVAFYVLGLMSKPTLVTLPLVLLLLDVWPLGRTGLRRASPAVPISRLVVEKIPLIALSIGGSLVTFLAQSRVGAVQSLETVPIGARLANATVSCVSYIFMTVWPVRLAPFYPYRPVAGWWVLCCLLILSGVSAVAVRIFQRRPYFLVGWLWYFVTLLPVLGLVQVGSQSMADRFMYLPLVGLLIVLVWGAGDLVTSLRVPRLAAGAAALAMVAAFGGAARVQAGYWKDSETLWRRAVDVVPDNDLAHANLGLVLADAGRPDEALTHFSEALRISSTPDPRTGAGSGVPSPEYTALLHGQIGLLLGRQGRIDEATAHFREALRLRPDADSHYALAQGLASGGHLAESIRESREAIRLDPGRAAFHGELASVLYRSGDRAAAIGQLEDALRLEPSHNSAARWHYNLAAMLNESGRTTEAVRELESALAISPGYDDARKALSELRKPPR